MQLKNRGLRLDGSKKLFLKEVNEVKVESCSKIKDGNERLVLEENEVRGI